MNPAIRQEQNVGNRAGQIDRLWSVILAMIQCVFSV